MLLEDHAGDIVRKAGQAASLSRDEAAHLAGVPTADSANWLLSHELVQARGAALSREDRAYNSMVSAG